MIFKWKLLPYSLSLIQNMSIFQYSIGLTKISLALEKENYTVRYEQIS